MAKEYLQDTLSDGVSVENINLKGSATEHAIEIKNNMPFDDIQVNLTVSKKGANPPAERTYNMGIIGGVDFYVDGFDVGESVYIDIQTSHQMKLLSALEDHIHYTLPIDGVGTRMSWQVDAICAGINDTWQVVTGSPFSVEYTIGADEHVKHKLLDLATFPACNSTVSSLYRMKMTRISSSQDEFGDEVYVIFNDGHYQKDTIGSRTEGTK